MAGFLSLPECFSYHPNSLLGEKRGYYPNIDASQLQSVSELKSKLVSANVLEKFNNINAPEDEFLKLLRFLRARKFDVNLSFDMIVKDIDWREDPLRRSLRSMTASEGVDKESRPISWRQFGKFEIWNVMKIISMERILLFHAWISEQSLRIMHETSLLTQKNIETFVLIVDAEGWGMGLATSDAMSFIQGMASTDSDHYPERLGMMIIINAPYVLSFAWSMIQTFLDEVTKKKIQIISNQSTWLPLLLQHMDSDQIPRKYGGTGKDFLTPEEAMNSMNPPPSTPSTLSPPSPSLNSS